MACALGGQIQPEVLGDLVNAGSQSRQITSDNLPDLIDVDTEILVCQNVTKPSDRRPGCVGIIPREFVDSIVSHASSDNLQVVQYGVLSL